MSHKLYWVDEPWLMRVDYSGVINHQDVEEVMAVCLAAADKHPVYFLVDLTASTGFNPSILRTSSGLKLLKHPNTKYFAYTGMRGVFNMGTKLFMRFVPFQGFNTTEEALVFLQARIDQQKRQVGVREGA